MAKRKRDFEIGDDGELISDIEEIIGNEVSVSRYTCKEIIAMLLPLSALVCVGTLGIYFSDLPIQIRDTLSRDNLDSLLCRDSNTDTARYVLQLGSQSQAELYLTNEDGSWLCQLIDNQISDSEPDFSSDLDSIVYVFGAYGNRDIRRIGKDGKIWFSLSPNNVDDYAPDWSPDGSWIIFASARPPYQDIYMISSRGTQRQQLTYFDAYNNSPVWSPDKKQIAFTSDRDGLVNLFVMDADGANIRRLTDSGIIGSPAWSPDGTQIAYTIFDTAQGQSDLWIVEILSGRISQLTHTPESERNPIWTTNGLLYLTNEGIHRMNTDGQDAHLLVALPNVIEFDYIE